MDDPIHNSIVGEESDDLHVTAVGAEHRVNFVDLADHLGPALGRDGPELLLDNGEGGRPQACLFDLASMGIGIEAIISDSDLALVMDMGSDSGNELQVVHPFQLFGLIPILVADLACAFIEGEALQGKKRTDHILSHPLGMRRQPMETFIAGLI